MDFPQISIRGLPLSLVDPYRAGIIPRNFIYCRLHDAK
jgi:hypothetical protein